MENPGAIFLIGRQSMPDLKDTIFKMIIDHMEADLEEGVDYWVNETRAKIKFKNGSSIISRSWHDKKFKSKFRSVSISAAAIEELTENEDDYKEFYTELMMRVGRKSIIKENFVICATNPDSPDHWAYKHFMESDNPNRHVYYSITTDNPFLPSWYKDSLLEDLDPLMAQRMVYGKWVRIGEEVIYHSYNKPVNYRPTSYEINEYAPISIDFDFNIGEGKPMSLCLHQYVGGVFHFFGECIVEGARTQDIMEELANRGYLNHNTHYWVRGDATGRSRDTRSIKTDYDIIKTFLSNYRNKDGLPIRFELDVPRANPPIRARHNKVNAHMKNALGHTRLYVYKDCPTLDEGFRLTKLKKGGHYLEDDSKRYQHVTTAAGYGIVADLKRSQSTNTFTTRQFR